MIRRCAAVVLACMAMAAPAATLAEPAWVWDARYRSELVDNDAFARDAEAHTLQLRLGYLWEPVDSWRVYLEGEHIESFGDGYNSTANGRTAFPVVADPEVTEVNQAWVGWQGEQAGVTAGRQRILLDNQRFIGNVGWRQNEQTFDALRLNWRARDGTAFTYVRLDCVHRVFGDRALAPLLRERRHDSHLFNASTSPANGHAMAGYLYLLEDRDLPADSSATVGARWTAVAERDDVTLGVALEAAHQREHGNQPEAFSLTYYRIEPYVTWNGITWRAGRERLDGDGTRGFGTPLATLHGFNGWADRFLTTPPDGLEDSYLGADGRAGKLRWSLRRHEFRAARGHARYGTEWNASAGLPLPGGIPLELLLKYADYRSDGFGSDVRKAWLQLAYRAGRPGA